MSSNEPLAQETPASAPTPVAVPEPPAEVAAENETPRQRTQRQKRERKTLLQRSKEIEKKNAEEKAKNAGPASPFSMSKSRRGRGHNPYMQVLGSAVKSSPMMPVLDPMAMPATSPDSENGRGDSSAGKAPPSSMPAFFDPSKMQQ